MDYRIQTEPAVSAVETSDATARAAPIAGARPRLDGIDFLRGVVMAIMVLDHMRDYLGASTMDPRDVDDPVLFLTRWITHFCAPIFVMLAGVSAYLYGSRGRTTGEIARFLLTRGLWLMLVEHTLVRLAWTFNLSYDFVFFQVIWAIGCAMVILAALVRLPHWAIATFGLTLIVGHHVLDGIDAASFGSLAWLWVLLHDPGAIPTTSDVEILALYPLIPWAGVMAVGYALGPVMLFEQRRRERWLLTIGFATLVGFIVLRATNAYGNPTDWAVHESWLATVLDFVNCEKYPPSLSFLAMTLGPGLIVLALFRSARSAVGRALVTIGRVPFLFYVAHIFVVHAFAVAVATFWYGDGAWMFRGMPVFAKPAEYGLALPAIYVAWLLALAVLYPLARWFAHVKQTRKEWWLSYL